VPFLLKWQTIKQSINQKYHLNNYTSFKFIDYYIHGVYIAVIGSMYINSNITFHAPSCHNNLLNCQEYWDSWIYSV